MRSLPFLLLLSVLVGCRSPDPPPPPARVLVSALQQNVLLAVDPVSHLLVGDPVPLPAGPAGMAARGDTAYVALLGRDYLEVVRIPELSEVRRIPLGAGSATVALNPAGDRLAVALPETGEVALVPLPAGDPVRVAVGGQPHGLAWDLDGSAVYVTNSLAGTLQRVGASGEVESEVPVGLGPRGVAVGAEGILVALFDGNALVVVPPSGSPRPIPLPGGPYDVLATGGGALVSLAEQGSVASVDLERGAAQRLEVGSGASGLARSPDGQFVYVACEAAGEVAVVGLHDLTVVARVALPIGARPREVVFVPGS